MKSILQDIISHTHNLGILNLVKITGDENQTLIDSISDDRSVILKGTTKDPYPDMIGVFGMPQLNKLKYNLECPEYREDAKIEIIKQKRNDEEIPVGLHFENKAGDFKNDYGFMNTEIINEKIKNFKFKGVKWNVEVEPTVQSIQRFQFQAAANNEHTIFCSKTDNKNLKFSFGDVASHNGEFVFASGVSGTLKKELRWPVSPVLSILKIADSNNTKLSISDQGAMQIELDSGLAVYQYIIPAQV